jgi:hypothetical protein
MKLLLAFIAFVAATAGPCSRGATADSRQADQSTDSIPRVTVRANSEPREYDWAKIQAGARIAFVSSGTKMLTDRMIDNNLHSTFEFSLSDAAPTVIVELAHTEQLHRISALYKATNSRLQLFLLNELPRNYGVLDGMKPFASFDGSPNNNGETSVSFAANNARYVALRWIRNHADGPIQVAEISAFSNQPTDSEAVDSIHFAGNYNSSAGVINLPPIPFLSQ